MRKKHTRNSLAHKISRITGEPIREIRRLVFQWSADIGLIEGFLIEDDRVCGDCFRCLEAKGWAFSSVQEIIRHARDNNWPAIVEFEEQARFLFDDDPG